MRVAAKGWLPLSTLQDLRIAEALAPVVERWSSRWFATGAYRLGRPALRQRGHSPLSSGTYWRRFGGIGFVFGIEDLPTLGCWIAEAPHVRAPLSESDAGLLRELAEESVGDLAAAIAIALDTRELATDGDGDPLDRCDGLDFAIEHDAGLPPLCFSIPAHALVSLRKSLIGSPARDFAPVQFDAALESESVSFSVDLGLAILPIGDARRVAIGDVLVLDTRLGDAIPLSTDRSRTTIATIKLSQRGGRLRLSAHTA